jgi:tight adherence protein C
MGSIDVPVIGLAMGSLIVAAGAIFLTMGLRARTADGPLDAEAYLRSLEEDPQGDAFDQMLAEPFLRRVLKPLGAKALGSIAALTPGHYRDRVQRQLLHAGLSGSYRAEEIITGQFLLAGAGVLAAVGWATFGSPSPALGALTLVALPAIGAMAPKAWLDRRVADRHHAILRDLPDTLDLLAISVEAGVGFEGALAIVCEQFSSPLAQEFSRTLKEMELGLPRREALHNLKRRTEVPELSNFVLALTQADALGMPIGRVLKTQSAEMRTKRRQWAREKAGKLPVKILFPLVLFIFPAVLVIVLGPAASDIAQAFK